MMNFDGNAARNMPKRQEGQEREPISGAHRKQERKDGIDAELAMTMWLDAKELSDKEMNSFLEKAIDTFFKETAQDPDFMTNDPLQYRKVRAAVAMRLNAEMNKPDRQFRGEDPVARSAFARNMLDIAREYMDQARKHAAQMQEAKGDLKNKRPPRNPKDEIGSGLLRQIF